MSDKKSIADMQIDDIAESQEIPVKEAAKQFERHSEFAVNLDSLPKQIHNWTDRGLKMTCEDAGHPWHEAWKRRKATV